MTPCACGSEQDLEDCCLPYIDGKKKPATAEALLRARYTSFTLGKIDFVVGTHHSKTNKDVNRTEIEDWAKNSKWMGFQIYQKEAGEATDDKGAIIFCAKYESDGKAQEHWEQALFEKEHGDWKFYDARGVRQGPYQRTEPKIGRNDPCSCGSGKKFKKCCAA